MREPFSKSVTFHLSTLLMKEQGDRDRGKDRLPPRMTDERNGESV